ncbi:MAG: hypothetical protein Q9163_000446 [Psora crenata]
MPTVILGAGIIGVSTAYYLSQSANQDIHLIEASPELFTSASGFAAGFLAADWFAPPLARLGQLSFDLHRQLAEENNGQKRWGYSASTGTSLAESRSEKENGSGTDWLTEGVSRATAAENTAPRSGNAPGWLQSKGPLDVLSSGDTTAQIDPRSLCDFLLHACLFRGVQLHQPAYPLSISSSPTGTLSSITVSNTSTLKETTIPCTELVIAAGAWSSRVFTTLFPASKLKVPITSLAGHSLVLRSKHWPPPPLDNTDPANTEASLPGCHAVFTTEAEGRYSPELFSRMPNGEVYLAGLNSSSYSLPKVANEGRVDPASINTLKRTATRLLGPDIDVIRESVCWRPVAGRGMPVITELTEKMGEEGKGVFLAAGHGAWGISLSLGTGYCVASMVEGRDMGEFVGRLGL